MTPPSPTLSDICAPVCTCSDHPRYGVEIDFDCPLHGEMDESEEGPSDRKLELIAESVRHFQEKESLKPDEAL